MKAIRWKMKKVGKVKIMLLFCFATFPQKTSRCLPQVSGPLTSIAVDGQAEKKKKKKKSDKYTFKGGKRAKAKAALLEDHLSKHIPGTVTF